MGSYPTGLPDLLAARPPEEALLEFLPLWAVTILAIVDLWRARLRASRRPLQGSPRPVQGLFDWPAEFRWVFCSFLVWAGISALRSWRLFEQLAWSHGPDYREFFVVSLYNSAAGVCLCFIFGIVFALLGRGDPAFGLRSPQHLVVMVLFLTLALDTLILGLAATDFTVPGGIPLRIS